MRRKILPRIFLGLLTATLISTMMVSSIFAKFVTRFEEKSSSAVPAAFDVEFLGFDIDEITINLAKDGEPAPFMGYFKETVEIPFSVKCSSQSEVAADVTIDIAFNQDFGKLLCVSNLNSASAKGVAIAYRIYKYDSATQAYVELEGNETREGVGLNEYVSSWCSANTNIAKIGEEVKYKIEFDVTNNSFTSSLPHGARFYKFISDAITVNVIARSARIEN